MKESRPVVDRISEVVSPILWTLGLELVDVVCVGQGPRSVVRVFIDKPGGVTLDDCERAHKALGPALGCGRSFSPCLHAGSVLAGSGSAFQTDSGLSPGGRKAGSLKLRQPLDGQWRLVGTLTDVADERRRRWT